MNLENISWGSYSSGELGVALSVPDATVGLEVSFFNTNKPLEALRGAYDIVGVDGAVASLSETTTISSNVSETIKGIQMSFDPNPGGIGVHNRSGFGSANEANRITYSQIGDAIGDFFGGLFSGNGANGSEGWSSGTFETSNAQSQSSDSQPRGTERF